MPLSARRPLLQALLLGVLLVRREPHRVRLLPGARELPTGGHSHRHALTGEISNGVLTLTLTPGRDTISGTYTGQAIPTSAKEFEVVGEVIFTAGTGRFAGTGGLGQFQGELRIRSAAPGWLDQGEGDARVRGPDRPAVVASQRPSERPFSLTGYQ
jgi:hypothetical protein